MPKRTATNPSSIFFDGGTYTQEQVEFIQACQKFRETHSYRNPSYQEILNIAHSLGYRRAETTEKDQAPTSEIGVLQ